MPSHVTPSRPLREFLSINPAGPQAGRPGEIPPKGTIEVGLTVGGTHAPSGDVDIATGSDVILAIDMSTATCGVTWPDGVPDEGPTVATMVLSFGDVTFRFCHVGDTTTAWRTWNCSTNGDLVLPAYLLQGDSTLSLAFQPTSGSVVNGEYSMVLI